VGIKTLKKSLMKKTNLLFLFLFLCATFVYAQQKKYVSYEVKKGETLKSIANDFNISTRDLSNLNPDVSRKPVIGTVIIVPNKNFGKAATTIVNDLPEGNYKVEPKETLYGISTKFGITVEELIAANPELTNGLKIGMILIIPEASNEILNETATNNFELHTVVKGDTMYNLTHRFNVSEAQLLELNPALKEGLKLGMNLKIRPIEASQNTDIVEEVTIDSVTNFQENFNLNKPINISIILPYGLNKLNDSLTIVGFEKNNSLLNIATDFHLGTVMAIDSLKRQGLKINVQYFDSENSTQQLQLLLNKNDYFNKSDFIIGPLFFDNAHWISNRTKSTVIAPFYSKKQEGINSDQLIKTSPNKIAYQEKLINHLENIYKGENILIVNDGNASSQSQLWQIVNKLKAFDSIQSVSVIKPENGYINRAKFQQKLSTTSKNWVILVSDENVTTSSTINNLKGLGFEEPIDIRLFALEKGNNFDNIDNIFLGKFRFMFPSDEYINPDDEKVTSFFNNYFEENFAYPSKYAIRGFDVTYDAVVRFASSKNFAEGLTFGLSTRVSAIFQYQKNSSNSIENNGLFLIEYTEDLTPVIFK
jgi:LysM repeat protein